MRCCRPKPWRRSIRRWSATTRRLPPLAEFILPGGSRSAAVAHVARTVARRAERALVALGEADAVNAAPRQYLNRLSDLLFVLARVLNRANLDGSAATTCTGSSEKLSPRQPALSAAR